MHLFLIVRGIKKEFDDLINHLQTQYFPLLRTDVETGKSHEVMVQGALRPIQLFEYVFPKESLPVVLTSLQLNDGAKGYWGEKKGAKAKWGLPFLRKVLGCKPMPNIPATDKIKIISRKGVGIEPIGIKEDGEIELDYAIDVQNIEVYKSKIGKKFRQEAL